MNNIRINDGFPYLTEQHKNESEEHIRMKNLAIDWLLGFGFESGDIEVERTVESSTSHGYTDVYAERDGFEVFVECERGAPIQGSLSNGGKVPAKKGKLVYFLNTESLYRVKYETVVIEKKYRSSLVVEWAGPETWERETIKFEYLGPIPSKEGSKYTFAPEAQRREREKVEWL